jgi:tRNA A-37 threonylcarbamoyl transferase component Bud32
VATIYIENKKVSVKENITRKALHVANRVMKTPFQIAIKDHNDILNCEEIIRIVPEKRILAFGKWGNQNVAIKLFYQKRHAKRHAERDAFGIESLMQANVPTARLLYKGNIDKGRVYILIFEKINHGVSLDTLWKNHENFEDMRELLHAVTIELATQHVLGILQRDLHLNNLLITPKHIYTLDGGMIDYFERPLDHKLSLEYLALFLVQLGVAFGSLQQELFKHYTKSRGWIVKPAEIKVFNKFISKLTEERMHNYKKKIFRKCTSFNKLDKFNKNLIYDRQYESPEFKALLANPDARIDNPAAIVLKAGRSSTVVKVIVDGRELVVKRYNRKNVWHGMRRCLRETRAKKSWRISQQLFASGVATPKPLAFI